MVQISWLWGLDKINPERVGAANDGGKSRGQPVNIGISAPCSGRERALADHAGRGLPHAVRSHDGPVTF
jgi:hypothetical protein